MSIKDFYDTLYAENETTFGNGDPEKIVVDSIAYRSSGSVFELGAGEGRNALFLAEQGFQVTAQDISSVGVEKIRKAAREKDVALSSEVRDIRDFDANRTYDIFVCTYVLQHLAREDALALIRKMQDSTNEDGLNVMAAFTQEGDFYKNNPDTVNFYPAKDELRELYAGWTILVYEETETRARATRPDGSPMINMTAKLIARKPRSV